MSDILDRGQIQNIRAIYGTSSVRRDNTIRRLCDTALRWRQQAMRSEREASDQEKMIEYQRQEITRLEQEIDDLRPEPSKRDYAIGAVKGIHAAVSHLLWAIRGKGS